VMRFHLHMRMSVVKVEAIQLGVNSLNGRLGMQGRGSGFQQLSLC
jgi:hypothetical protein